MTINRRTQKPDLEINFEEYFMKMKARIVDCQERIETMEKMARQRNAQQNDAVRQDLEDLERKLDETIHLLNKMQVEGQEWPEISKEVSGSYKKMKNQMKKTEEEISPR